MDMLQVYYGSKLVGHLKLDARAYANKDHVIIDLEEQRDLSRPTRELYLETVERHHAITHSRLMYSGTFAAEELKKHHVPSYARWERNVMRDEMDYSWRVVQIHLDHIDRYELLFDLDVFEPLDDGPLCPERPKVSRVMEWAKLMEESDLKASIADYIKAPKTMLFDYSKPITSTDLLDSTITTEKINVDKLSVYLDEAMLKTLFSR